MSFVDIDFFCHFKFVYLNSSVLQFLPLTAFPVLVVHFSRVQLWSGQGQTVPCIRIMTNFVPFSRLFI